MREPTDEWDPSGPRGLDAMNDMASTLTREGLLTPPVPRTLANDLMVAGRWAWATSSLLSPWEAYMFQEDVLDSCLSPDVGDFWMCAYRGHGIGSHGIGLIARVGPLVVAQQFAYGGFFGDADEIDRRVNVGMRAWARTAAALDRLGAAGPARCQVEFSDFRRRSLIRRADHETDQWVLVEHPVDPKEFPGWLDGLSDPVHRIAARHLSVLITGDAGFGAQAEDDEANDETLDGSEDLT